MEPRYTYLLIRHFADTRPDLAINSAVKGDVWYTNVEGKEVIHFKHEMYQPGFPEGAIYSLSHIDPQIEPEWNEYVEGQ